MNEIYVNSLIVGAGVTGLMMANCLKDDYVIIDKEKEIGGFCRTIKKSGYIWDYAGHFFHFNNKRMKEFFLSKMRGNDIVNCKKNTKIYYKGDLIDYPFQANIHELKRDEFIDCLYDLFFKVEKSEYENFEDMLYGKYGKSITEKFLKPYNEKLYACALKDLDCNAMGRFFPNVALKDIIGNMKEKRIDSYNNEFIYPKEGAGEFVKVLADDLDLEKIFLNFELVEINEKEKYVEVRKKNNIYIIHYNKLISTIPFHQLLKYLKKDEYRELAGKLSYNKVLVFNIGFDKSASSAKNYHWIYFPDKEINFYRVGFYNNILGMERLSMYVEIGYDKNVNINIDEQYKKSLKNLKRVGIISDHQVVDYETLLMSPAYIHINEEHNKDVDRIILQLEKEEIYCIGRYGKWKYCSVEDSMLDAVDLSFKLNDEIKK